MSLPNNLFSLQGPLATRRGGTGGLAWAAHNASTICRASVSGGKPSDRAILASVRPGCRLTPAGVFYVNLRGEFTSAKSRAEALEDPVLALRQGFQHAGRFDKSFLDKFDPRKTGEQFNRRGHAPMSAVAFRELLIRTTERLRHFGKEIFSGEIAPAPYRKGRETACDHCDYASVCRFDPWTQSFRALAEPTETLVTPAE